MDNTFFYVRTYLLYLYGQILFSCVWTKFTSLYGLYEQFFFERATARELAEGREIEMAGA
jgi:hypothetical protein